MKVKCGLLVVVVLVLFVNNAVFADRQLEKTEILQILSQLTSQSTKTWIPAGTIRATHTEYSAPKMTDQAEISNRVSQKVTEYQNNQNKIEAEESFQKMKLDAIPFNTRYKLGNESTMTSAVTVKYDGNKFYWEIDVASRADSVKPGKDVEGNFMAENFNMDWNAKRIFAWDGEKYTMYSLPVNGAVIDAKGNFPHVVNGPLTAGLIPWGHSNYSYDKLAANELAAVEESVNGSLVLNLTVTYPDGMQMQFAMDVAKNYAVLSCLITTDENIAIKQYSNFQLVSGNWVPKTILMQQLEAGTNKVLNRDLWEITSIDGSVPQVEEFSVPFQNDASIEFHSAITDDPVNYKYSDTVDTDKLLMDRLSYAAGEGSVVQNCATASLKYVAEKLGKQIDPSQLSNLVNTQDNTSSLYAMKQLAENLGLHCRAIKTDINTLKELNGCQVILHIPGKNHFVALDSIDGSYINLVDLSSNRFYYQTDVSFFGMDWTGGTALLVSNQNIAGEFEDIENVDMSNITGASGFSCTRLLQQYNEISCQQIGDFCEGLYTIYFKRFGCQTAAEGSCSMHPEIRIGSTPCIEDPYNPFGCTVTGEWTNYYMQACNAGY